jgi:hypothetical protein
MRWNNIAWKLYIQQTSGKRRGRPQCFSQADFLPETNLRACHSERSEESPAGLRFFAALRMTGAGGWGFAKNLHVQGPRSLLRLPYASYFRYLLVLFMLALVFVVTPGRAHAAGAGPSLQVNAGFGTRYRDENWIPVQVTLNNTGADFNGTLSLTASLPVFLAQGNTVPASSYNLPIALPNGTQKQVTIDMPLYYDEQSIVANLLDGSGKVVVSQTAKLNPLQPNEVFVGILSDATSGFGPLNAAPLPVQGGSVALDFLNAGSLPTVPALLKNFDMLVLDNFTTGSLSAAQLAALHTWVQQGGTLLLVGGPEADRTLNALPTGLLPGTLNGVTTVAAKTALLPPGWPAAPVSVSLPVVASQLVPSNSAQVVFASSKTPLVVQAQEGQGSVLYLAYDPTLEPVLSWQGVGVLWEGILLRGLSDGLLAHASTSSSSAGPQQPVLAARMSSLLQSLLPKTVPTPGWGLGILLIGYILLLGPVRFLLITLFKRRDWSWRIVLSSIVVFSLLSYALALKQKSSTLVSNSISIAVLGQDGAPASITTYLGVFVPNQGNFQVHIPGNGLVQPSPETLYTATSGTTSASAASPATVVALQDGNNVNLQDVDIWTMHSILSQQDRQLSQGLTSQLTVQNGALVGTVTNTLGYTLNDAFLLLPNNALSLGRIAAGATKHIKLTLNSSAFPSNFTLTDLIAQLTNSPDFLHLPASPATAWQRHLSMLYALDGEGDYGASSLVFAGQCNLPVPILPSPLCTGGGSANNSLFNGDITPGWESTTTRATDPLLVPGAPVTLIGWVNTVLDSASAATVDNNATAGFHETLVQAPLAVNLASSSNLLPDYIAARVVDVAASNVQVQLPGVYSFSTGSMTFEFAVPTSAVHLSGLSISGPDVSLYAQGSTAMAYDTLPFRLYNWQTHAWDSISFSQGTFSTSDVRSYISTGGRVLLQLANQDKTLGTFIFGKPLLSLQGDQ